MEQLTDLKAILHSKRANIYYLEYCRVLQKDGRVLYLSEKKKEYMYWNIPIANTTCLLLGTVNCRIGSLEEDDLMHHRGLCQLQGCLKQFRI